MRLFVFNVLMFGALMLGWVSCQEYESGTYPLEESTVRYEGTLYDYLADKAAHPDKTADQPRNHSPERAEKSRPQHRSQSIQIDGQA